MRKVILVLAGAVLLSSSLAFAEDQGMMGGPQGEGGDKGKMMGMMRKDSVVATSDGGVVVLSGPRLLKYDASLTLVKDVELPKGKPPEHHANQQDQNQQQ